MSVKISIIGAGSGIFSLNLIKDLCLTPSLSDAEVCFMDIDAARLKAACALCERYAAEVGARLRITKTQNRRQCLKGAHFVVNTALAGGYGRLEEGWRVARRLGYRMGGSLHIMHDEAFWVNHYQLCLMEDILRDILEICPNAWYVMVANPIMAGVTYLARKYPGAKLVGMCHGFANVYGLAELVGLPRDKISFEIPGVNHFVWLNSLRCEGRDGFEAINAWLADGRAERYWATCKNSDHFGKKAFDLYRKYGVFPIGDTGNPGGGSWGYHYHTDAQTEQTFGESPEDWYRDYIGKSAAQAEKLAQTAANAAVRVTEAYPAQKSPEPMVPLIEALACDVDRVVVVNVINDGGYVKGVPADFEVEVPALCSGRGIQGLRTKPLPAPVRAHMLRDRIAPVNMELAAFEGKDKGLLLELVKMDPWTQNARQAEALLSEILALPENEKMHEYYK